MNKHHPHGARELPSVTVDGYSLQLRGKDGFIGDQASQTAFRQLLERWRQRRRRKGNDPLGGVHSKELSKRELDEALGETKTSEAADMLHGAIEEFAEELAWVIDRFMRQPSWKGVQRIVIGGGFPGSDVGERVVLQAAAILQHMKVSVELARICHEPDDGGLLGWVHLVPPPMLKGHDAIVALDIGGTNVRCGIVKLRKKRAPDLSKAKVVRREKWRHADDGPSRKVLIDRLAEMVEAQIRYSRKQGIRLAPFIGIACPGLIRKDGSISRGAQNLPGDWESDNFHLPSELVKRLPQIAGEATVALMHNDAVVQGLSELPFMQDVKHWAVLTIGTGLGNASFTNKARPGKKDKKAKAGKRS
ncbi:ROK family protein [Variovorax ginsengisoli]|uniref:ROK family protein n=1 Tax=Variovorax ginsengisoli TaxID=363844 RepID=A0ABT8SD49_9BURK|nr:ROK family protein [Variovorax ginsengisoli]MDN8617674.1 ROK family protein [Variovorax ginsengisoli]MDO1536844.1 ROK family protein [Variovorax ginsengisoli]